MYPTACTCRIGRPRPKGRSSTCRRRWQRLADHRESFNVLTGLTLDGARAHGDGGGDHARSVAAFLTGAHPRKTNGADIQNGISVDQVTAQYVGDATRFASSGIGHGSECPGGKL